MRPSRTFHLVYAVVLLLAGAALLTVWLLLDLASFGEGFCLGGGITLLAGGVYLAVTRAWKGSADTGGTDYWLPSRDTGGAAGGATASLPGNENGRQQP